jgi:glycosyltransferase involved in cell wall biosynthesis
MDLTVTVAVYNEEDSLPHLCTKLHEVLSKMGKTYEVILVDDGSKDNSWGVMQEQARLFPNFKLVRFRRNFGQTAAISAGFRESQGDVVITLDADLQNDPEDIPMMLEHIDRGFDVVSGWRKDRQDTFINRKLPSMLANRLIGYMTGVRLHDYGCSLKAYRREIVKGVRLYGEMHRFIPALAHWVGGTIDEVPVRHHARKFGTSKYGISRTLRVVLDLMTVKFLLSYSTRPIQVFGRFGLAFGALAFALLAVLGLDFAAGPWWGTYLVKRPFWVITPLMFLGFALQFLIMGLLAELMTRTYHESQDKAIYTIRDIVTSADLATPTPL